MVSPRVSLVVCVLVFNSLAGCGSSSQIAAKADVIITIDSARKTCLVALLSEAQGSAVACEEVVPFVRDELRVAGGSIYDIRTTRGVDPAATQKVQSNLNAAGYRFIGGHAL